MTSRLGIFGGTFNPPHSGHMILAAEAADQLQLDRVLWMLTPNPPHKQNNHILAYEERAALVQACIGNEPKFELSMIENERKGPHYTADTLVILREKYPDTELVLLIGGDSLQYLPAWHKPALVLKRLDQLGVMARPGDQYDWLQLRKQFPGIELKAKMIDAPLLEISSSEIRERIASNRHFRYYLNDPVYRMIVRNGHYRNRD